MNKVLIGLWLGAVLGAVDGATAWFTPEARAGIAGIIVGSTIKGIMAGVAAGWFARKVHSIIGGLLFGIAVGALLAGIIVALQHGQHAFEIMLPGTCVGAIVGWATQRYGRSATAGVSHAALLLAALIMSGATPVRAASQPQFDKLAFLVGTWDSEFRGSKGWTTFARSLQDRVLVRTNHSDSPAHDDLMVIYVRGTATMADYYDSEGHVIHYTVTPTETGVTFLSEAQTHEPRYRLTYEELAGGDLDGRFEVAPPDKPFATYLRWRAHRRM